MNKEKINIYTDGACSGNPGPGGFAYIIKDDAGNTIDSYSAGYRLTTNNRMELKAITTALSFIDLKYKNPENYEFTIVSDSKYIIDSFEKGWIEGWKIRNWTNVKNVELMQSLYAFSKRLNLKWVWVKGHSGHPENDECDKLAVKQTKNAANHKIDTIYEEKYAK